MEQLTGGQQIPADIAFFFITGGGFAKTGGLRFKDAIRRVWREADQVKLRRFFPYCIDYDEEDLRVTDKMGFERFKLEPTLPQNFSAIQKGIEKLPLEDKFRSNIDNRVATQGLNDDPRYTRLCLEAQGGQIRDLFSQRIESLVKSGVNRFYFVVVFCPCAPTGSTIALFLGKKFKEWRTDWQQKYAGKRVLVNTIAFQVIPHNYIKAGGGGTNAYTGYFCRKTLVAS